MASSGPVIVIIEFIKGVVQRTVHSKLRSDFQMVRGDTLGAVHKVRHARGGEGVPVCDRGWVQEHVTSHFSIFFHAHET